VYVYVHLFVNIRTYVDLVNFSGDVAANLIRQCGGEWAYGRLSFALLISI
jgi:hypothetical protein